ncbi:hypothetical protein [Planctopirus hydrillae]|uniref:DUF4258 domain-containing protein n=1 Tax=Planctopirus hydrillae TaxID=1841610 RepID=A0A1C3EJC7_9PLAN|nr:hypothetical protein [Planctopirus hydrillae]ODA33347.1 hypothetical protein A6X21_18815 [Planctopirus hydrillae]
MPWFEFFWTPEIEQHVAEHGVTVEQFEYVVMTSVAREFSHSNSQNTVAKGYDQTGRWLICVYEMIDTMTVLPVTAYEPTEE